MAVNESKVDQFIKIGDLEGEADDTARSGETRVISWNWEMSQSGTFHHGTKGSSAGRANVQDMVITAYLDKIGPNLMKACCNGTHYDSGAKLTVRKADKDGPLDSVAIEMKPAMVTGVKLGEVVDGLPTVTFRINFGTVKMSYIPQKDEGGGDAAVEAGWNIAKCEEC